MAPMGGVLAIDHGERKTGFAVADPLRLAVHPLEPVRCPGHGEELLEHIAGLLDERDVSTFLVGMPYLAGGEEGGRSREVRAFVERLVQRFPGRALCLHDEHLTTKEAEAQLREAGYRGREASQLKDSWSAWVLLRDWIESGEPSSGEGPQA